MSAIGKGSWVQCVASAGPDSYGNEVAAGVVYCVERIAPFNEIPGNHEGDGLKLVGVGNYDCLWAPERFRPLGGNTKTITAPPVRIREDA